MYAVFYGTISDTTLLELCFKTIFSNVLMLFFLLVPSAFPILNGTGDIEYFSAFAKLIALPVSIL